jgi:hypothetical protein
VVVAIRGAPLLPAAFDLAEEVVVGVAGRELTLLHEDAVELAAVEPDAAAFGARINQDLAPVDLYQPRAVHGTAERFAAQDPAAQVLGAHRFGVY